MFLLHEIENLIKIMQKYCIFRIIRLSILSLPGIKQFPGRDFYDFRQTVTGIIYNSQHANHKLN